MSFSMKAAIELGEQRAHLLRRDRRRGRAPWRRAARDAGRCRSTGSTEKVTIFSGVSCATSSMSMPPSVETTKATRDGLAVDQHREVELLVDRRAFLDIEAVDLLALRAGLVRDQRRAEHARRLPSSTSSIDFTTLTPPALPRPPAWICAFTTQTGPPSSLRGLHRLVDGERRQAARHRHAEFREDRFGLVFVDVHAASVTSTATSRCEAVTAGSRLLAERRRDLLAGVDQRPHGGRPTCRTSSRSAPLSSSSTMRSTPLAPITTGTPT